MKNLSPKQIAQVKEIKTWTPTKFHGNRKKVGSLPVAVFKAIVEKKVSRSLSNLDTGKKTIYQEAKELINWSKKTKGTPYFKVLIEGNTGIYYASPIYMHADYNKSRVFERNAKTLKLMTLINAIINK
jgi:hypothetical protein